ncbi:MAG: helix-turn-helix transcriptional regulator [Oscillospiraceae bacterium]|nr:helix-turn-helix transcriptional regulator [Oscillospiraceae bacterium]
MKDTEKFDEERINALKSYPVAYRLQQLRAWSDYTQEEVANLIGSKQSSISMWERGLFIPNNRILAKIISVYHLPNDFFEDIQLERSQMGRKK